MQTWRGIKLGGLALVLTALVAACGPATAVLPRVHVRPPLVPVKDHTVRVLTAHPVLTTRSAVLSVSPSALTRGNLDVWIKRAGAPKRILISIGGLDFKWLRRWQVAGNLALLEVGTPSSARPKSNEYLHVLLVVNIRTGKLLYQGSVALTTIAFLDPPWLVKAGPASILGRAQAVWLINVKTGLQERVLFPPDTVGVGEVRAGRIDYIVHVKGQMLHRSLAIPRQGWTPYRNLPLLKVSEKKNPLHSASGAGSGPGAGSPTQT